MGMMPMRRQEYCPHCAAGLNGEPIPDTEPQRFYGREIGVEIPGTYDGILFWMCPDCGGRWHRWDMTSNHRREADPYVTGEKAF